MERDEKTDPSALQSLHILILFVKETLDRVLSQIHSLFVYEPKSPIYVRFISHTQYYPVRAVKDAAIISIQF